MSVMSLFITYLGKVCFIAKLHIKPKLLDLQFCIFVNQQSRFLFHIMKYKLSRLCTS